MIAKEIVDGMQNDEQGREIVHTISRAIWLYHGYNFHFTGYHIDFDNPSGEVEEHLKSRVNCEAMAILHELAAKGFYVGSTMSKDLEEIDDAIDH